MNKLFAIVVIVFIISCTKDSIEKPDCENLRNGLLELNETMVKNEIEKLTSDLHPHPQAEDLQGHMLNLQTLTDRLNSNCLQLNTSVKCYACIYIYTYPPLSEILVEFEESGEPHYIIIDIVTAADDILRFGGVHLE